MIYKTGDVHCPIDVSKLNTTNFPDQKFLTKSDYLIVAGDMGLVWNNGNEEKYWRKWFSYKNFTTLFVDGNHENHDLLESFPVIEQFDGKVRVIEENVYQLMRGEVYTIDGKTIFTMGGATSIDKIHRVEGKSWWAKEIPSDEEFENGLANLERVNYNVDYIFTHCAPDSILAQVADWYQRDKLTNYLEVIKTSTTFKKWYFGHYHLDRQYEDKFFCLYQTVKGD